MPIPKPTPSENETEFVNRCMSEIGNEYDQQQALAICFNTYREEQGNAQQKAQEFVKESENKVKEFLKSGK